MIRPLRFLSVRLFLLLLVVLVTVFGIHTIYNIRSIESNLTDTVYASAAQASDLIVRSTRHGMLRNHKEDVRHIIRTLGNEPGFVDINIYDKSGTIIFSTDSTSTATKVDLQAEACIICHASDSPLVSVPTTSRMRVYEAEHDGRILGLINPIRNEPECYNAPCHAHTPEQTVLGVLDVKMSLASVDARVARARREALISALIMTLLVCGISGWFIYRVVRKPFRALRRGMDTIAAGDLDAHIELQTADEIGDLARAFNTMAGDLQVARDELHEWAQTLEDRVDEKTEELKLAQSQIVHMEKMASLGKLSASVAHEINNPLFGILTYSKLLLRDLGPDENDDEDRATMRKHLSVIHAESSRCGDIVKGLLDFARQRGGEFQESQLTDIIERTVILLRHHFEMAQITVHQKLDAEDDTLRCDAKQIQQAIVAPCINAVEAMPAGGSLTITTSGTEDEVVIEIKDTGIGMPESVRMRVFEPFFTTKEGEAGLGLGLAVTYGIVQRHSGRIDIESETEKGTLFRITLPRKPVARGGGDSHNDPGEGFNARSETTIGKK